jgi:hypothetical protein
MVFRENYTQPAEHPKDVRAVMADSQVVNCNRLSYQQVIHILPPLQAPNEYSFLRGKDGNYTARLKSRIPRQATQDKHHQTAWLKSIPSQCTLLDRCVDNSVQDKPVFPSTHVGGLLDMITRVIKWPPFQPPSYKSIHPTKPNDSNHLLVHLSFWTFPSCSRNWGLCGQVDPIWREACRNTNLWTLPKLKGPDIHPTHLIPISSCRYWWVDSKTTKVKLIRVFLDDVLRKQCPKMAKISVFRDFYQ